MRKILFIGLIGFILLMGLILAADFTPQGDINLRSTYDLWNAIQINSTSNITAGGYFVGDGSYITGIAGYTTWAQVVNGTVYLSSNPFGFYNSTNPSPVTNTSYYLVTNPFSYYNSTDFSIGDYYLKNNPYSYYNSTNPSPVINTSYYLVANPFSFYNETNFNVSDYYLLNNPYSYYNSTNPSPVINTSYYLAINPFGFYNSTDFSISDYFTKTQINNFDYYNSTDFSISDYLTSAQVLGFSYYNSTDFSISDYYTSSQIDGFSYWNDTTYGGIGNWSADKGDYSTTTQMNTAIETANTSLKDYSDVTYEPISTQFDADSTANITCLDYPGCNWYMNATDSCMYWPSGGKDCGAA